MIGGFLQSSNEQLLIASAVFFAFRVAVIALTYFLNNHLTSESLPQFDPVWLIWKTLSFAWKHKSPVRPSAFIYCGGTHSRLDLAKERYGGPFTTKQVENVRSFWYLLLIPFCHVLCPATFFFRDTSSSIHYFHRKRIFNFAREIRSLFYFYHYRDSSFS